ncbi:hypothetical protein [Laspinema olomoucense]|uniref:hypothetical protein n=1 Tax=Laspinema olomoucense TaxID=3231600 RepID=UPI0021BB8F90|nr:MULTISPECIES: hypothetical protein [unclassified Laspinema]MCT7989409.1 hypothetical protein [Laspinema sp. D3a]MCT7992310.1 hypothetical protein [Laspinema sp. D3c]
MWRSLKLGSIAVVSLGLIGLTACGTGEPGSNVLESATQTPTETVVAPTATTPEEHPTQGGQVIEVGPYHLELVALPEPGGVHLDFYLQTGDTHKAIPAANVTAQVEMPTGEQRTLELPYDETGEHYATFLPAEVSGEYKVAILTDIQGKKVNGRFTFNRE